MKAAVSLMAGLLLACPARAQSLTRRIVVAGADVTEIVFALDAQDHLVGVDQTSTWPPQAQDLPRIGYVRCLSAEGILSLDPDLLIAAHDAGPDLVLQQLQRAGVVVVQPLTWTAPMGWWPRLPWWARFSTERMTPKPLQWSFKLIWLR